jgi:hypothetical protein
MMVLNSRSRGINMVCADRAPVGPILAQQLERERVLA